MWESWNHEKLDVGNPAVHAQVAWQFGSAFKYHEILKPMQNQALLANIHYKYCDFHYFMFKICGLLESELAWLTSVCTICKFYELPFTV